MQPFKISAFKSIFVNILNNGFEYVHCLDVAEIFYVKVLRSDSLLRAN